MTPVATGTFSVRRVPVELARRRLGPTALQVLRQLWAWRDDKGIVTVSRKRLARSRGFAPISVPAVMRAMRRLADAGLVEDLGWRPAPNAPGLLVYARRVYGAEARSRLAGGGWVLVVPEPVAAWVTARKQDSTRGGGQGRGGAPRGNESWAADGSKTAGARADRRRFVRLSRELERARREKTAPDPLLAEVLGRGGDRGGDRAVPETMDRVDPDNGSGRISSTNSSAFFSLREKKAAVPAAAVSSLEKSGAGPIRTDDADGLRLGPPGPTPIPIRPRAALGARVPGLPRFPTLKSATVPNPPRVDSDAPVEDAARELARAYAGAYEHATGKKCWAAHRPERTRNWSALLAAAEFMQAAEMAPAAWVAWSFDMWARKTGKPPPLGWVFSIRRLGDRYDWFRHEGYDEIGGAIVAGPKERALFRRYAQLLQAVDRERAYEDASAVTERFFPEGWERAVYDVEREIRGMREELERRLSDGEWLWSGRSFR